MGWQRLAAELIPGGDQVSLPRLGRGGMELEGVLVGQRQVTDPVSDEGDQDVIAAIAIRLGEVDVMVAVVRPWLMASRPARDLVRLP